MSASRCLDCGKPISGKGRTMRCRTCSNRINRQAIAVRCAAKKPAPRTCRACGAVLAVRNSSGFCQRCAPFHRAEWTRPTRTLAVRKCTRCESPIHPNSISGLCRSCSKKAFFLRDRARARARLCSECATPLPHKMPAGLCRSCTARRNERIAAQRLPISDGGETDFRRKATLGSAALLRRQWATGQVFAGPFKRPRY